MLHFLLVPVTAYAVFAAETEAPALRNGDLVAHQSGGDILAKCTGTDREDQAFCLAYVTGIADEMSYGFAANKKPRCPPQNVAPDQLRDVVVAYLEAHSEQREYAAVSSVSAAYADRWCNLLDNTQ